MVAVAQTKTLRQRYLPTINTEQVANARAISLNHIEATFGSELTVGNMLLIALDCEGGTGGPAMITSMVNGAVSSFTQMSNRDSLVVYVGRINTVSADKTLAIGLASAYATSVLCVVEVSCDGATFSGVTNGGNNSVQYSFNYPLWWSGTGITPTYDCVIAIMGGALASGSYFTDPPFKGDLVTPSGWVRAASSYPPAGSGRCVGLFYHVGGVPTGEEYTCVKHNSTSSWNVAKLIRLDLPLSTAEITLDTVPAWNSLVTVALEVSQRAPGLGTPTTSISMGGVTGWTRHMYRDSISNGHMELWYGKKTLPSADDTIHIEFNGAFSEVIVIATEFSANLGEILGADGGQKGSNQANNRAFWTSTTAIVPTKSKVLSLMIGMAGKCHQVAGTFPDPPYKTDYVTPSGWLKAAQEVRPTAATSGRAFGVWWHIGGAPTPEITYLYPGGTLGNTQTARLLELSPAVVVDADPIASVSAVGGQFTYQAHAASLVSPQSYLASATALVSRFLEAITEAISVVLGSTIVRKSAAADVSSQSEASGVAVVTNTQTPPAISNRSPTFGARSKVAESTRFSLRGEVGHEVLRGTINCYVGSGPAFYTGEVLPEAHLSVVFLLRSLFPNPVGQVERSLEPNGSLKIVKGSGNLRGVYEFGGQQSPADPQSRLMGEFTLELKQADVSVDGNSFTGVVYGMWIDEYGIQVKFYTNGTTRWLEIHDGDTSSISPPNPAYKAVYDWDQGSPHIYKILWDPKSNRLRLYVSSGPLSEESDIVLIDGLTSAFTAHSLPVEQRPSFVPAAFFGHGYPTPESTSYWHSAAIHNMVGQPIVGGIARGGYLGFLSPDNVIDYVTDKLPRDADKPWTILPDSFATIGGHEEVSIDRELILRRQVPSDTIGFYRVEPSLVTSRYLIFDFKISGEIQELNPNDGQASGIEVYVDDGVKKVVIGLLSNAGTQSVGLLLGDEPNLELSYSTEQLSWVNSSWYRLIFQRNKTVRLVHLVQTDEGVYEQPSLSTEYTSLPDSDLDRPVPSLGFLLNGNTISSKVLMRLGGVRYSTNNVVLTPTEFPLSDGWAEVGAGGTVSSDGLAFQVEDTSDVDSMAVARLDSSLDSENGFVAECRCRVGWYKFNGEEGLIRRTTGAGFIVDDGTYSYFIVFADAGPSIGKIVFLSMESDIEKNLLKIRADDPSVAGTYAVVDWTTYHMYRLEKTTGSLVQMFIDNDPVAAISKSQIGFAPAPTSGSAFVGFGSFSTQGHQSLTEWQYFSYGVSKGFDISVFPDLSENEILRRFSHAFNIIVEGANV